MDTHYGYEEAMALVVIVNGDSGAREAYWKHRERPEMYFAIGFDLDNGFNSWDGEMSALDGIIETATDEGNYQIISDNR